MNAYADGLTASEAAADFSPVDEQDVLDELALATAETDPWTAAHLLFVGAQ